MLVSAKVLIAYRPTLRGQWCLYIGRSPWFRCDVENNALIFHYTRDKIVYLLVQSMKKNHSREACSYSASQKYPNFRWNQRFIAAFMRAPARPSPEPYEPSSHSHPIFKMIHFNIIFPFTPRFSKWFLFFRRTNENCVWARFFCLVRATCCAKIYYGVIFLSCSLRQYLPAGIFAAGFLTKPLYVFLICPRGPLNSGWKANSGNKHRYVFILDVSDLFSTNILG